MHPTTHSETGSLGKAYQAFLTDHGFESQPSQVLAIDALQKLIDRLESEQDSVWHRTRHLLTNLLGRKSAPSHTGIYLWGNVGGGKTCIMDLFYKTLPIRNKKRIHFYRFMEAIHAAMKASPQHRNPIEYAAEYFATHYVVICIDEFHITNIADAMIMHQLLQSLFDTGMILVISSNASPDKLYQGGLQYERFVPAIELIKQHHEVVHLDNQQDYRMLHMTKDGMYFYPHDEETDHMLHESYFPGAQVTESIEINQREIATKNATALIAWFELSQLCDGYRSVKDYIEIADRYEIVIISDIPAFSMNDDVARRFIHLIDELYDRRVDVIISAAVSVDELYQKGRLHKMFERTKSRLKEMQSEGYYRGSRYAIEH